MAVTNTQQRNPYIVGRPITEPERFFGREDIFQFINDSLDSGVRVILLYGQRRIGKSSVLYHIPHFLNRDDVHFVHFNLQGKEALPLAEVLHDLAEAIVDSIEDQYGVTIPLPDELNSFQNRFLSAVYDAIGDKRLLLLLDEFDVLNDATDDKAALAFFPYLQELLQTEKRMFIVPVVGRRLDQLPTLLSLFREGLHRKISLLDHKAAERLLVKSAEGLLKFDKAALDAILELTAGHPYFTQLMGYEVFRYLRGKKRKKATGDDVQAVIDKAIESGAGGLAWFWDGLITAERELLSAVAEVTAQDLYATQKEIQAILKKYDIPFSRSELEETLGRLVDWEILKEVKGHGYQVMIELVRRWVVKAHSIRWIRPDSGNIDSLIKRWKAGDNSAFEEIYRRFDARLYASIRGMFGSLALEFREHIARDLCQETWVTAHRRIHTFNEGKGKFFPWLRVIARNHIRNWNRRKQNQEIPMEDANLKQLLEEVGLPDASYNTEIQERTRFLMETIKSLPIHYSSILSLHMQEYTLSEIAKALNISLPAVRVRFHRAIKMLQKQLLKYPDLYDELGEKL